jgi:hypothetical protein
MKYCLKEIISQINPSQTRRHKSSQPVNTGNNNKTSKDDNKREREQEDL